MRLFELLLLGAAVAVLLRPLYARKLHRGVSVVLLLLAIALLGLHVFIEGYRWQMSPAYVLVAFLVVLPLLPHPGRSGGAVGRRGLALLGILGGLGLLAIAAMLATLVPVVGFPEPSGPYGIGTVTFHWVDSTREEYHTDDPRDRRELMVQVWYPAESDAQAPRALYMEDIRTSAPILAANIGLPRFAMNHMALVRTHAMPGAPISQPDNAFPLLIFSHGNTGVRVQNTAQFEHLVSHGYVVASIDHTYNCAITVFPDGRTVLYKRGDIQFLQSTPESEAGHAFRIEQRAADVSFVLDQLELANAGAIPTPFTGRVDLDRVGVFGHSYGGATATLACRRDARIKAGINLDGWIWGDVIERGLAQPFLSMFATEKWYPTDADLAAAGITRAEREAHVRRHNDELRRVYEESRGDAYYLAIDGTRHFDFSDIPLLSPLTSTLTLTGSIDGRRAVTIINAYTLAFFDRYLRGRETTLLQGPSTSYPEVRFELRLGGAPAATTRAEA